MSASGKLHFGGEGLRERQLRAYSVEKLLLIWVPVADSIVPLILEFDRDDGTTSGITNGSVL